MESGMVGWVNVGFEHWSCFAGTVAVGRSHWVEGRITGRSVVLPPRDVWTKNEGEPPLL